MQQYKQAVQMLSLLINLLVCKYCVSCAIEFVMLTWQPRQAPRR